MLTTGYVVSILELKKQQTKWKLLFQPIPEWLLIACEGDIFIS